MDQDNGQRDERPMPERDDPPVPRHRRRDDPPVTESGLPRRTAQRHLEPRLRRNEAVEAGTAFSAFADAAPVPRQAPAATARPTPAPRRPPVEVEEADDHSPAADFHDGVRRGRRTGASSH